MAYTTDALVAAARREIFAPDASDQTDADVLAFADQELDTLITKCVRPGRDGRWLTHEDIAITPGTTDYPMPERALGRTLRGVMVVQPDGLSYPLTERDPLALRAQFDGTTAQVAPVWYAIEEQTVRLGSVSSVAGYMLRVFYLLSPPRLILTSAASLIEAVASSSELTVSGTPDVTTFAVGAVFDVVSGDEPYPTIFRDLEVAATSAGGIEATTSPFTFGSPSVPAAQVQNRAPAYAVPRDSTVYPPIVRQLWPSLVQATGAAMLEATNDDGAEAMRAKSERSMAKAIAALYPRDDRRSKSIVGSSPLRTNAWGARRWAR